MGGSGGKGAVLLQVGGSERELKKVLQPSYQTLHVVGVTQILVLVKKAHITVVCRLLLSNPKSKPVSTNLHSGMNYVTDSTAGDGNQLQPVQATELRTRVDIPRRVEEQFCGGRRVVQTVLLPIYSVGLSEALYRIIVHCLDGFCLILSRLNGNFRSNPTTLQLEKLYLPLFVIPCFELIDPVLLSLHSSDMNPAKLRMATANPVRTNKLRARDNKQRRAEHRLGLKRFSPGYYIMQIVRDRWDLAAKLAGFSLRDVGFLKLSGTSYKNAENGSGVTEGGIGRPSLMDESATDMAGNIPVSTDTFCAAGGPYGLPTDRRDLKKKLDVQ
ncbi:hypothetical protein AAG570_007573 [Ranatra chinensis]|uniref:Uncharacterized protein n=1 Tax=Ranatra chinensis TaxID=642074 RepID=A0ABD0YI22_9HEMI